MNIVYILDTMQYGGAAKKISLIANELAQRNHKITIITDTSLPIGFELSDKIKVLPLIKNTNFKKNQISKFRHKLLQIRNLVSSCKPDIVVSVLPHVSFYTKISLIGKKIPIVFSDETSFARKDNKFIYFIRHYFYNFADRVVVLTENDVKLLGRNIPKKIAIHNPVKYPSYNYDFSNKKKTILAIGPLKEWYIKGFDLLFKAFSKIAHKYPDWNIAIAGDDREPYKTEVLNLAIKERISNQVRLLGFQKDIYDIMRSSSIYALSSRIEGFSLSLVEALSQGCSCIAFENHGVIQEVSCGGKGVVIIKDKDVDSFSAALEKLMNDETYRKELAQEGRKCITEYEINSIVDKWEITFKNIIRT